MFTIKNRTVLIKRFTILLALLVLTLGSLPAQAQDAVKLRFTVWIGPGPSIEMLKGIAADYTAKNPNVTVQFDTIPFNEYTAKLTLQLAGSNPPDGGWILENTAPQFIASGVLTDLAPTVAAADYEFADFEKSALALWQQEDKTYALPFSTSPFLIIYNADAFAAAGLPTPNELSAKGEWTWQKLAESAKKIAETQKIFGFESVDANVYKPGGFWNTLVPIIRAYGGDAWDAKNACQLTSAGAVDAVKLYHSMVFTDKSAVPPGETGDFFTGKSAITIGQISRLTKLDNAKFKWDIAPLPKGSAGEAATTGQAALAIFANSKNQKAALDFLGFLTNKENSVKMAQFFPSARKTVLSSETFLKSNQRLKPEQMQLVVDGIAKGRVLPSHPNFSQISLASNAIFDELWVANADVGAVLDKACKAIQPLLTP
jgi:multiple sugar transport system substrate-binding protein